MDFDALIDRITAKVAARIAELESSEEFCGEKAYEKPVEKPKVLALSGSQERRLQSVLQNTGLSACYQVDFLGTAEQQCDFSAYEAVVLFDLTIEALAKIGTGLADSPYTKMAVEAILTGLPVFVPKEEVELFLFKDTAPKAYYQMMCDKLNLMAEAGVTFCTLSELKEAMTADGVPPEQPAAAGGRVCAPPKAQKEWKFTKRVVTEKDINEACMEGATCVLLSPRTIVTDLAKDRAKAGGLSILRK